MVTALMIINKFTLLQLKAHKSECVKCTLFKSYCTSLYTCQLWCCYRAESLRKLCVAYNNHNVFRFVCNEPRDCSASYMFVSRGLPTCKMLI